MKFFLCIGFLVLLSACNREPTAFPVVQHAGSLRNITELADTTSHIYLDTIKPHRRLYGLGPLAGMTGEIMIVDGRPYVSRITGPGSSQVRQTFEARAPYLVYAHIRSWKEVELPQDSILDNQSLGRHLKVLAGKEGIDVSKPFPFLLKGHFQEIVYHISDVHKKKARYVPPAKDTIQDADAIVLGFFSTSHHNVFTEPGSDVVMSFMTTSASVIGQIDQLRLNGKRVQLLLPN